MFSSGYLDPRCIYPKGTIFFYKNGVVQAVLVSIMAVDDFVLYHPDINSRNADQRLIALQCYQLFVVQTWTYKTWS